MKHLIAAAALAALPCAIPSLGGAQDIEEGADLLERGAELLLRGILEEIGPELEELDDLAQEIGPAFDLLAREMGPGMVELMGQIDSFTHYQPPEVLPNGDIILRRREDAPEWVPPVAGEIEL